MTPKDLTLSDSAYFIYTPLTATDVEQSFSGFKLLAPNWREYHF